VLIRSLAGFSISSIDESFVFCVIVAAALHDSDRALPLSFEKMRRANQSGLPPA
jgi:hypothetical protein